MSKSSTTREPFLFSLSDCENVNFTEPTTSKQIIETPSRSKENAASLRSHKPRSTLQASPILNNDDSFSNCSFNSSHISSLNISLCNLGGDIETSACQRKSHCTSSSMESSDELCDEESICENRNEHPAKDKENEDDRLARENEESEALARLLMAEEAVASYSMSSTFFQDNADNYSSEDLAALQAALEEDEFDENEIEEDEDVDTSDLSYDALLMLGERIGDVKQERWTHIANGIIDKMRVSTFCKSDTGEETSHDCDEKCLICQFPYEDNDTLRHLPCKHTFHTDCVDKWLQKKDFCPYCRQSVAP